MISRQCIFGVADLLKKWLCLLGPSLHCIPQGTLTGLGNLIFLNFLLKAFSFNYFALF